MGTISWIVVRICSHRRRASLNSRLFDEKLKGKSLVCQTREARALCGPPFSSADKFYMSEDAET